MNQQEVIVTIIKKSNCDIDNDEVQNDRKKHFYDVFTDIIESNILCFICPHELCRLCTVSKLFNSIIFSFNWNDDYKMNREIYYLIYDKLSTLPLKYLIIKAWIETFKTKKLIQRVKSRDTINWPVQNSCLKRKSGVIITGGAFQSKYTSETIFIDNQTNEITEIESMPFSIGAMASIIANENALFLGGWSNSHDEAVSKIFSLHLNEYCWGMAIYEDLPLNICYSAAVYDTVGNIFLLGGSDNPYRGAMVYDKCYMRKQRDLVISYCAPDESDDDEFFATHGLLSSLSKEMYFNYLYEKDNSEINNWIEIPSMNTQRCGHCAVQLFNENIVVLGGYEGGNDYLKSSEMFDKNAGVWIILPDMNDSRSGPGSCIGIDGSVYVFGGSPNGEEGHHSFERLDVREKKWFQLPTNSQKRGYTSMTITPNSQIVVSGGIVHLNQNNTSISIYDIRAAKWFHKDDGLNYNLLNRNSHNCFHVL